MNLLILIIGMVTMATSAPFGYDRDLHLQGTDGVTRYLLDLHQAPQSIKTAKQLTRFSSDFKRKQNPRGSKRGKQLLVTLNEDLDQEESRLENQFDVLPLENEHRVVVGSVNRERQLESDFPSKIMPYDLEWNVDDEEYSNYYGHRESASEGTGRVEGEYYNLLPDGRLMRVEYYVEGDSGFVPKITYEPNYTPTWGTKLFK